MSTDQLLEARREARGEAILFVVVTMALLIVLAVTSLLAGWELIGLPGWVWFALCIPEAILIGGLFLSAQVGDDERHRRWLQRLLALVVLGNLIGLLVLLAGLLTEESSDLSGAQLLTSGVVVWLTNVIVFGLSFWTLDSGGPVRRALAGRRRPDFLFPQDGNRSFAPEAWYPRLEDYVYVALTNAIAFSPTDAMPLTRWAKSLMAVESMISVAAVLLVAARAVNIIGA
jgi:hypothetical protein